MATDEITYQHYLAGEERAAAVLAYFIASAFLNSAILLFVCQASAAGKKTFAAQKVSPSAAGTAASIRLFPCISEETADPQLLSSTKLVRRMTIESVN